MPSIFHKFYPVNVNSQGKCYKVGYKPLEQIRGRFGEFEGSKLTYRIDFRGTSRIAYFDTNPTEEKSKNIVAGDIGEFVARELLQTVLDNLHQQDNSFEYSFWRRGNTDPGKLKFKSEYALEYREERQPRREYDSIVNWSKGTQKGVIIVESKTGHLGELYDRNPAGKSAGGRAKRKTKTTNAKTIRDRVAGIIRNKHPNSSIDIALFGTEQHMFLNRNLKLNIGDTHRALNTGSKPIGIMPFIFPHTSEEFKKYAHLVQQQNSILTHISNKEIASMYHQSELRIANIDVHGKPCQALLGMKDGKPVLLKTIPEPL